MEGSVLFWQFYDTVAIFGGGNGALGAIRFPEYFRVRGIQNENPHFAAQVNKVTETLPFSFFNLQKLASLTVSTKIAMKY